MNLCKLTELNTAITFQDRQAGIRSSFLMFLGMFQKCKNGIKISHRFESYPIKDKLAKCKAKWANWKRPLPSFFSLSSSLSLSCLVLLLFLIIRSIYLFKQQTWESVSGTNAWPWLSRLSRRHTVAQPVSHLTLAVPLCETFRSPVHIQDAQESENL